MYNKNNILNIIFIISSLIFAQNNVPVVENITASQRTDGSKIVDIYYDISDADGDSLFFINLLLTLDGGETFTITPTQVSGDIGSEVQQGDNKHIIWNAGNENFTLEGNQYQFKVIANDWRCGRLIIDYDGNEYQTILIGNQCWMSENLKVTHYQNGDAIPNITNNGDWGSLSTGAYGDYDNNPSNSDTYGRLYNWYTVDDSRGVCPAGWHVPSDEEYKTLEMFLGMSQTEADDTGWRGTNEGSKLAGNASLWNDGSLTSNAEFGTSGFSGFPSGYRDGYSGSYYGMGYDGYFWSSTEGSSGSAWYRLLGYGNSDVGRGNYGKQGGFSVRCVRPVE